MYIQHLVGCLRYSLSLLKWFSGSPEFMILVFGWVVRPRFFHMPVEFKALQKQITVFSGRKEERKREWGSYWVSQ